jgi:hypothetical protein
MKHHTFRMGVRGAPALLLACAFLVPPAAIVLAAGRQAPAASGAAAAKPTDLDAFMARVLERREEAWRTLHDYVLDEVEQLRILGPGAVPLHGMKREFTWYVREGFLIRSPVKFDGVTLGETERRAYEQRWLDQEKQREERAAKRAADAAKGKTADPTEPNAAGQTAPAAGDDASLREFVDERGEPRFVSEAYFLRFKFEPGNYYAAGRDTIEGRQVVKVEYYPTRLFQEDRRGEAGKAGAARSGRAKDREEDEEYERQLNKVALVTLWIDPAEHQIVRYTFDNVDFGFLPGRWLVRLDEIRVSMTMARVLGGVWLPGAIEMRGGLSLASGGYQFQYQRHFANYRKAETGARIRNMTPRDR